MKKIAIVQSNYIPWKGYFDLIAAVDEFVIFDDVQYTKHDWRNRNLIKTPRGVEWLTVPVLTRGKLQQTIRCAEICDNSKWASKHWKTLVQNYGTTAHFHHIAAWLEPLYRNEHHRSISTLNRRFISAICDYLGIKTMLTDSAEYRLHEGRTTRLIDICRQAGGTEYISGPSAQQYLDTDAFADAGIKLTWFDYRGYPEYPQLWGQFHHQVSILDLLFNCGPNARRYMRHVGA